MSAYAETSKSVRRFGVRGLLVSVRTCRDYSDGSVVIRMSLLGAATAPPPCKALQQSSERQSEWRWDDPSSPYHTVRGWFPLFP